MKTERLKSLKYRFLLILTVIAVGAEARERVSLNGGWRFMKDAPESLSDGLTYDVRPVVEERADYVPADAMPTEAEKVEKQQAVLKAWILPTGNDFIKDPAKRFKRPEGNPGEDFPFAQADFDDSSWELVDLPHDWAISGKFYEGWNVPVGGGMGRLPSPGIGWYRRQIQIGDADEGKRVFLDIDGAMSYAMVWINGSLAGGWPYGYASWRVDLTPYIKSGANQLAIKLDNPADSSRWYSGGGIYRNVWLVKTSPVHVPYSGTYITTSDVSKQSATVDLQVSIKNSSETAANVAVKTSIYALTAGTRGRLAGVMQEKTIRIDAGGRIETQTSTVLENPALWGPPPEQKPNLYLAVTSLFVDGRLVDEYETGFGIRSLRFDPDKGIFVNGIHTVIKGANQHHDLGALGAAFNVRAAERQLEMLREAGCNAIRMSHNPPAPELLELTDRMGFLVLDEIFDVWERKKAPLDFHLIFPDWYEQDVRSFVRRDRNHPSVIIWSFGNEVGEQYTGKDGAQVAEKLNAVFKDEDPTRPTICAMNYSKPDMPLSAVADMVGLNYQGEGIRNAPAYAGLKGISTPPIFPEFHKTFPDKVIISTENAAALSTRGTYLFPVYDGLSSPVKDGAGGDSRRQFVSSYELYSTDFGSSADKVFRSLDMHGYVAGGFVWSGWDYLGEPTPYYGARSSYFGIIDLAGFKKDRFYLYQSYWRPELPMAHVLPHWTWPGREGKVTPVHVFTSGNEAELFLNGTSLGRKSKGEYEYRLRWDDVAYESGELKAVAYKGGKLWADDVVKTAGEPAAIELTADKSIVKDLAFITARIVDSRGVTVPMADNLLRFKAAGAGEIIATDNGDPTDFTPFPSHERKAFSGLCLAIVRPAGSGAIEITAQSGSLASAQLTIETTTKITHTSDF